MLEGDAEREELSEGVPTKVVFLFELLHVLRSRTTRTGFEQTAAVHQRDDGEHLRRGAQLKNREEVGQVVTQDVTGNRDGVLACLGTLKRELGLLRPVPGCGCRDRRCRDP